MAAFNTFFKDLAAKIGLPDFFKATTLIFNNLFLALFALVVLIALILVIIFVPNKKKKAAELSEKSDVPAEDAAKKAEQEELVEQAPEETLEEVNDQEPEEVLVEDKAEQQAPAEGSAPAVEAPAEEVEETPAEEEVAADEESEGEAKGKVGGKYEIVKRNDAFYFLLKANNGQLLLESHAYTSLAGAKGGIDTFKNAVENGEFVIDEDKNGNFKFILRASARSQMLYHGETYATRQRAESAIGSVKNFAFTDVIKRMEEDDEDDSAATPVETKPLSDEENKEGGKYEIEERNGSFYFLLKANNGQLLLESPAFTSEHGAKSGIDTFKKAADTGFFVVDVDKKGKFRFILRANARAQMRYFGESYSTRQSAESSVHSVRSFAQKAILK